MKTNILFIILSTAASSAEPIRIEGSDALGVKLVPLLTQLYEKNTPDTTFSITANGSQAAFAALIDRNADIGMSNREPKTSELERLREQNITLLCHIAVHDSFAIIVNKENPIENLTLKQVEAIFTGDLVSWAEAGGIDMPIVVHTGNTSRASYTDFRHLAMGGREYAKTAVKVPGSDSLTMIIENDRHAITYVGLAYANAPKVRALRIDDKAPSHPSYHLRRSYFYYLRSDAGQPAKDFITWATSSHEAMALIRKVGFLEPQSDSKTAVP